jgi:hypothetical protein
MNWKDWSMIFWIFGSLIWCLFFHQTMMIPVLVLMGLVAIKLIIERKI